MDIFILLLNDIPTRFKTKKDALDYKDKLLSICPKNKIIIIHEEYQDEFYDKCCNVYTIFEN